MFTLHGQKFQGPPLTEHNSNLVGWPNIILIASVVVGLSTLLACWKVERQRWAGDRRGRGSCESCLANPVNVQWTVDSSVHPGNSPKSSGWEGGMGFPPTYEQGSHCKVCHSYFTSKPGGAAQLNTKLAALFSLP